MANLRGNSLVGGKPIVTIDMLNKFVEDIQAAQKDEMMHKYEREVITSNQVIDAYIKDKSKNGVWLCSNVQNFPMYNYGTLVNLSADGSRFQLYAPHIKASGDKYSNTAGLFFRTGWGNDIKEWKEIADIKYVNEKDNEIKEDMYNSLKAEQKLSYEGTAINANNTLEGRTEGIVIKGQTLHNLLPLRGHYNMMGSVVSSNVKIFNLNTEYTMIVRIKNATNTQELRGLLGRFYRSSNTTAITVLDNVIIKNGEYKAKFTIDEDIKSFEGLWGRTQQQAGDIICDYEYIFLKGDWTNKDVPNYFEEVKSFGEEENNSIDISSNGVNVFNAKKLEEINYGNRFKLIDANSNTFQLENHNDKNLDLIKLMNLNLKGKTNVTFYLSTKKVSGNGIGLFMIFFEDGTFLYAGNIGGGVFRKTFEKPIDKIVFSYSDGGVTEFSNVCISEKDIDFKPYEEENLKIQLNEPLRKDDYIYQENEDIKLYRKTKQYIFNGNEEVIGFNLENAGDEIGFEFPTLNLGFKTVENNFPNAISNKFNVFSTVYIGRSFEGIALNQNGKAYIRIKKSKLETQNVEGIKKWLRNNKTYIIYEAEVPTIKKINSCIDMNISTFKDRTYIKINNNIKGNLNAKIPTNIYSLINNNGRNINKIYKKLKESFFIKTILLTDWQQSQDAFKYSIKHNLGTKLIANVAATKVDGMSTNIDYKIVDENTIEIYVIDKAQLDIIIKTI